MTGERRVSEETRITGRSNNGRSAPFSEEEIREIRAQLERILDTHLFRISRRYPSLLRYVVEQTLEGHADRLKERTLGIEVFGRDPDYDTNEEPVVRMTAAQVRRRLQEYYQEPGRESELRIELPVGSYVPHFVRPEPQGTPAAGAARPAAGNPEEPEAGAPAEAPAPLSAPALNEAAVALPRRSRRFVLSAAVVVPLVAFAIWAAVSLTMRRTALERFWGPVWESSDRVLICVGLGLPAILLPPDTPPKTPLDVMKRSVVAWADATTLSRLASFLRANGKQPVPSKSDETTFAQMRETNAVLIGGFNNQWIMRFTGQWRFYLDREPDSPVFHIRDRQNPGQPPWTIDDAMPLAGFTEDFGIVARYFEPTTQRYVVVASGVAYYGTLAAGEFLTDEESMRVLAAKAPSGWERKNIQAVFSTKIINGETGRPTILAVHVW